MSAEHSVAHEDASLIQKAAGVVVLASDDGGVRDEAQKKREREDEAQAGARITVPAELHAALHVPIPSFADGLEPIPVTAANFCASLLPAFALGTVCYRVRVGAIRRHKKVAFFEVSVEGGGARLYGNVSTGSDSTASNKEMHNNAQKHSPSASGELQMLTQLVVDAAAVGADCFSETLSLCLGDVLDVDARWIWDPRRACPLNLAAAHFRIVSRWDTETVVALRKGGYHKIREHAKNDEVQPLSVHVYAHTHLTHQDHAASAKSGGCWEASGEEEDVKLGSGGGIKAPKLRGVIKTRRVPEIVHGGGGGGGGGGRCDRSPWQVCFQ